MDLQKVTVTGYVDQMEVLKMARRRGRKAEFWQYPYDRDESAFSATYNYYCHGFNESMDEYFPDKGLSTVSDDVVFIFNDDNPHAYCSLM